MEEERKKRVLWKKITVGVLLLLVVSLSILILNINTIARNQINKTLDRYLKAGGNLETFNIYLLEGKVILSGLVINSPPGFETHPLLSLNNLEVNVAPWALLSGKVVVEDLTLYGLSINIVRNKKGRLSILELMVDQPPGTENQSEKPQQNEASPWIPVVHAHVIQVGEVSFSLVDRMLNKDWSASLRAGLKVEELQLQDFLNLDILVGSFNLALNNILIDQPPGFSKEPLLAINKIDVSSSGIDLGQSKVDISDVMLDTVSVSLERNADREVNLLKLAKSWLPLEKVDNSNLSASASVSSISSGSEFKFPAVAVDNIHLKSMSAQLLDSIDGQPWQAGFEGMDIGIKGVKVADLSKMAVSLTSLDMGLRGITVDQPPGFSKESLLSINKIDVSSPGIDLGQSKVFISDLNLDTLGVSLERNAEREINVIKLAESWLPEKKGNNGETPEPSALKAERPNPALKIPSVTVGNVHLNSIRAQLLDSMDGQLWRAGFDGLDLRINKVELGDPLEQAVSLGSLDLDLQGFVVDQPPGFSETPLVSMGSFKLASRGIDLGESKVAISDVTLDTLNASLERNAEREINLQKLIASWLPENKADDGSQVQARSTSSESSEPGLKLPSVVVDNVQLNSINAQLLDSIDGQPWQAWLDGLNIQIVGMQMEDLALQAISLASLDLDLNSVTVDQLPGFSETPLLSMGNFKLVSREIDLGESKASISDVNLDTLSASLERNTNNELNLLKLKDSWLMDGKEDDKETLAQSAAPTDSSGPALEMPSVEVDRIQLNSISAQMLASIEDQPWRAGFDGLDILITGVDAQAKPEQVVSLASFDLDLNGVKVDQPPGFGERKLFGLEQFTVISEKAVEPGEELVIKQVQLKGLTSSVTMRADGMTNLQVLRDALIKKEDDPRRSKEEKGAEKETPSAKLDLQPVLLEHFSIDGGPVTYRDEVFTEEHLEANLDEINMDIKGLRFFPGQEDVKPASATISFTLEQLGDLPTAYFGTIADVGPIGKGVPMVNTQVRLVGLKLDTLGSLVPSATREALGASGLDVGAALAIDADSIYLHASVFTDRHIRYEGITVQGPLDKPVVKIGPVMAGVFGRVTDGLANLGIDGLKATYDITEGGVDAVIETGSGAAKVGLNLAKSLFDTTAGLLTLEKEKVKQGISASTKGTVDITKDSVGKSGKVTGDSLKRSATGLKGQERIDAWDQEIPKRYKEYMQHARKVLAEMPYPPVTK